MSDKIKIGTRSLDDEEKAAAETAATEAVAAVRRAREAATCDLCGRDVTRVRTAQGDGELVLNPIPVLSEEAYAAAYMVSRNSAGVGYGRLAIAPATVTAALYMPHVCDPAEEEE